MLISTEVNKSRSLWMDHTLVWDLIHHKKRQCLSQIKNKLIPMLKIFTHFLLMKKRKMCFTLTPIEFLKVRL